MLAFLELVLLKGLLVLWLVLGDVWESIYLVWGSFLLVDRRRER